MPEAATTSPDIGEDEPLLDRVHRHYKECATHTSRWRTDAREDYGFVDGSEQWDEKDKETLREQLRPPVTFNRVGPVIDAVTGSEIVNRQETRFYPREQGDVGISEHITGAVDWVRDLCDAEDEESDAFHDMVVCGMGWTETKVDYEVDLDGQILVLRTDPLEMGWDTTAKRRNLADAKWQWRVKKYTMKEIRSRWPDKVEELAGLDGMWEDDLADVEPHNTVATDQYKSKKNSPAKRSDDGVRLIEYQWYETRAVYRMVDINDPEQKKLVTLQRAEYTALKDNFKSAGMYMPQATKQMERVYKRCFVAGKIMLEEGPGPCKHSFSYKCMTGKRDRNRNIWYGLVRGMKDPQRWANKWLSQIMFIINSNAKGGILAEEGAFKNSRKAESQWADPTAITMLKAGGLKKIEQKTAITFPSGLDRLMEFAVMSIRDVAGVNVDQLGQRQGNQQMSGALDYQRKEAGIVILGTMFGSLRRYRKEQGRLMLYFVQEYLSDGRLVRITGKEGAKYVPLMKDEKTAIYDVIVDDAPTSPNQKDKTFAVLSSMLPQLLQAGVPIPPEIIEYAPLPETLIGKWKELLAKTAEQAQGPGPEEIAMMQQAIGMLQAENDRLKSDLSLKAQKQATEHGLKRDDQQFKHGIDAQDQAHDEKMAEEDAVLDRWKAREAEETRRMAATN